MLSLRAGVEHRRSRVSGRASWTGAMDPADRSGTLVGVDWSRTVVRGPILCVALGVVLSSMGGCALPSLENRPPSVSLPSDQSRDTPLGQAITPLAARHSGKSGLHPMGDPRESFAVRVLLARAATRTLDLQYYIWHGDTTGTLLMAALREAAERGVRVRVLLDDNGIGGLDADLAFLDEHENIEVRLFNPFPTRRFKKFGYVHDFSRLNRRMHNKSFTADGQASVVGGRNVGDEYFGATAGVLKSDLDVLLVGPVASEISTDFDRYWVSDSAYPVSRLVPGLEDDEREQALATLENATAAPEAQTYLDAIRESTFIRTLLESNPELAWSDVRMVTDDPAKGLGKIEGEGLLINQLDTILARPERSVVLVSPYFVPTKAGTDAFVAMAERGVAVSILTNSLEATDVVPVHAGYAKRRKALLAAGVRLFEMKRLSDDQARNASAGPFGSSASSLHAKTFAIDGERAFIGSFNFDPRSMHLNTELGFVIESAALASEIEETIEGGVPDLAYEVRLGDDGSLYWLEQRGENTVRLEKEPNSGWGKRAAVVILSWLPIEWML